MVFWHKTGNGNLRLPFTGDCKLETELGRDYFQVVRKEKEMILPVAGRQYFSTTEPMELLTEAFENAAME